jgi:hypothetical protein
VKRLAVPVRRAKTTQVEGSKKKKESGKGSGTENPAVQLGVTARLKGAVQREARHVEKLHVGIIKKPGKDSRLGARQPSATGKPPQQAKKLNTRNATNPRMPRISAAKELKRRQLASASVPPVAKARRSTLAERKTAAKRKNSTDVTTKAERSKKHVSDKKHPEAHQKTSVKKTAKKGSNKASARLRKKMSLLSKQKGKGKASVRADTAAKASSVEPVVKKRGRAGRNRT